VKFLPSTVKSLVPEPILSIVQSVLPLGSIAGDEIAKVTDSIASPARASDGTKPILSVTHTLTSVTQAELFIINVQRKVKATERAFGEGTDSGHHDQWKKEGALLEVLHNFLVKFRRIVNLRYILTADRKNFAFF